MTRIYSKSPDKSHDPSQARLSPYRACSKPRDEDMDFEWSDEDRRVDIGEQPPSKRPPPPLIKHDHLSRYSINCYSPRSDNLTQLCMFRTPAKWNSFYNMRIIILYLVYFVGKNLADDQ